MAKIVTIRVKKRGGGTRLQKAMKLASGKLKFVKNTTKSSTKRAVKKTKSAKVKRKSNKSKSMAKKKSSTRSKARSMIGRIPSPVKKVAAGIGLATVAVAVTNMVAPQASGVVRPVAAFVGGGPLGLIGELVLNGGLGNILGGFGFGNSQPQEVSV